MKPSKDNHWLGTSRRACWFLRNTPTTGTEKSQEPLRFDSYRTNPTGLSRSHLANWGHLEFYRVFCSLSLVLAKFRFICPLAYSRFPLCPLEYFCLFGISRSSWFCWRSWSLSITEYFSRASPRIGSWLPLCWINESPPGMHKIWLE